MIYLSPPFAFHGISKVHRLPCQQAWDPTLSSVEQQQLSELTHFSSQSYRLLHHSLETSALTLQPLNHSWNVLTLPPWRISFLSLALLYENGQNQCVSMKEKVGRFCQSFEGVCFLDGGGGYVDERVMNRLTPRRQASH